MLSEPEARFVEDYFRDVARVVQAQATASPIWNTMRRTREEPRVRLVISTIWGAILDHVAVHGHRIHRLPKQGDEQAGILVEART
jgi:hypothetical protein